MPLEVNEIGITMRVTGDRGDGGHQDPFEDGQEDADEKREQLIEECVRRVLQALKTERER
jgi:hypothetical protein